MRYDVVRLTAGGGIAERVREGLTWQAAAAWVDRLTRTRDRYAVIPQVRADFCDW